jgi:DNA repair protein RadD
LLECSQCSALRLAGQPCPACGFLPKRPAQYVPHIDGDLALVDSAKRQVTSTPHDPATRNLWHAMLSSIANERGYQRGWVAHKYKEKFGTWPAWGATVQPIEPTPEVRSWVRSRLIAYAKAREHAA